jgi:hypothetical protein
VKGAYLSTVVSSTHDLKCPYTVDLVTYLVSIVRKEGELKRKCTKKRKAMFVLDRTVYISQGSSGISRFDKAF